jgi:formamidopyrimidine-DNA glycosylase
MPELPEVEVVKNGLQQIFEGRPRLVQFEFRRKDLRHRIPRSQLIRLQGERILSVDRRAKFLLFSTDSAGFVSHLGMTGTWRLLEGKEENLDKHDHILLTLQFDDRTEKILVYRDPRRFGIFDFWDRLASDQSKALKWGKNLGPEPLGPDFDADYLFAGSRKKNTSIKSLIMDQAVVVGVGNIYASESLFLAKIRPQRKARNITRKEAVSLVRSIQAVLKKAIAAGGSSISDFKTFYGNPGEYHLQHFVYDREGKPCRKCNTLIKARVIAGRNSFWCPVCQK